MKTLSAIYLNFSQILLEDRIYEDPDVTFYDLCAALCVSPSDLDEILFEELGMKGPEILQSFQKLLTL